MNISFKANFIHNQNIIKNNKKSSVSFVQIDTNNSKDIQAIKELDFLWGRKTYAGDIYQNILDNKRNNNFNNQKYYILTNQKNNFDIIDSEKILGITEIQTNQYFNKINFLQVAPNEKFDNPYRKYKHIGKGIINSIKEIFSDKTIILYSNQNSIPFYKKMGFKIDITEPNKNKMIFNKNFFY